MDFYKFSKCVYTAQGDMVCDKAFVEPFMQPFVEPFVEETPNIASYNGINKENLLQNAINKNYCDINAEPDAKTGEMKYSFKKECIN